MVVGADCSPRTPPSGIFGEEDQVGPYEHFEALSLFQFDVSSWNWNKFGSGSRKFLAIFST